MSGLLSTTLEPTGIGVDPTHALRPGISFREWADLGSLLFKIEHNVMWWIGDWWLYGEREYGKSAALAETTGYALETVRDAARVSKRFPENARRPALSWGHHREVAGLSQEQQYAILNQAEFERLSTRDLRRIVRRIGYELRMGVVNSKVTELATMGHFPIILADPPWRYEHGHESRAIENKYDTMALDDICELKVPAADDAILFLWSPAPKLAEALQVVLAWGFDYRTNIAWVKPSIGPGNYVRCRHEHLLIARKGTFPAPAETVRPDSVFEAPRGPHSQKPGIVHEIIEAMYPGLPKVEMFARSPREGWVAWGDQA